MPTNTNTQEGVAFRETVETSECSECGGTYDVELLREDYCGNSFCADCYTSETSDCDGCGERVRNDNLNSVYDRYHDRALVCDNCRDYDYACCDSCEEYYPEYRVSYYDSVGESRCDSCVPSEEEELEQSTLINRTVYPDEKGTILTSDRFFGIELEAEGYFGNVDLVGGWGRVHDGSLDEGIEFISPPMRGKIAEEQVQKMTERISKDMSIEATCGYHIHVSTPNISDQQIKRLLYGYIAFDDIFVAMIPESRRKSTWSAPLSSLQGKYIEIDDYEKVNYNGAVSAEDLPKIFVDELSDETKESFSWWVTGKELHNIWKENHNAIKEVKMPANELVRTPNAMSISIEDIERWWYSSESTLRNNRNSYYVLKKDALQQRKRGGKYDQTRYAGLNMHILFQEREINPENARYEVRYHGGTLNPRKILMWAEIHTKLADALLHKQTLSQRYFSKVLDLSLNKKVKAFQQLTGVSDDVIAYIFERIELFKNDNN